MSAAAAAGGRTGGRRRGPGACTGSASVPILALVALWAAGGSRHASAAWQSASASNAALRQQANRVFGYAHDRAHHPFVVHQFGD